MQLNQYKMKGHIGQGSYGIVKLAYDRDSDCHYVRMTNKLEILHRVAVFPRENLS